MLTMEQERRTLQALVDTKRALEKELGYSKDLQKQDRIIWLRNHIQKLNKMLKEGWE